MTIQLGGQEFTEDQIIAAIAASNDPAPTTFTTYSSIDEVSGVIQAVLHRLAALEDRLPVTRAGYGVTTTTANGVTKYRVQTQDHHGDTMFVTFEVPTT